MDYVAAIDIGTTNLKCQIFSPEFGVAGSSIQKVRKKLQLNKNKLNKYYLKHLIINNNIIT